MTLKEVAQQVADELTRKQLSDNAPMTGTQLYLYAPHLVKLGLDLQQAIDAEVTVIKTAEVITSATKRSCNRHDDCELAETKVLERNPGMKREQISPSFHCHSDDCEECFGN